MRVPGAQRTLPRNGIDPSSARNSTVLPAPFGPIIATTLLSATVNARFLSTSLWPNRTDRPSTSRIDVASGIPSASLFVPKDVSDINDSFAATLS
jgi:hypothetical protein